VTKFAYICIGSGLYVHLYGFGHIIPPHLRLWMNVSVIVVGCYTGGSLACVDRFVEISLVAVLGVS